MDTRVLPQFQNSVPFWLKVLCIASTKLPYKKGFAVTFMEVFLPVFIVVISFFIIYIPVLLWTRWQHVAFLYHFIYVFVALFVYVNLSLVLVSVDVGVASFVCLLFSVHIIYFTALSLGRSDGHTCRCSTVRYVFIPNQYFISWLLHWLCFAVILISWISLPHVPVDYHLLLFAVFAPETTGTLLYAGYSMYDWYSGGSGC